MKLKRIITLLSVTFLFSVLLIALSTTCAFAAEETTTGPAIIIEIDENDVTTGPAILIEIDKLEAEGKYSNDVISSIFLDFSDVSTSGAITMTVYEGIEEDSTVKSFSIDPLPWKEAEQQLVKYALGNIANLYRTEPYNTDITCKTYELVDSKPQPRMIIPIYICGPYKAQAAAELFNGIPNCFTIEYYPPRRDYSDDSGYSGSMSVPVEPIPTPIADYSQYYLLQYSTMLEVFEAMKTALETGDFNAFADTMKSRYFLLLFFNIFNF